MIGKSKPGRPRIGGEMVHQQLGVSGISVSRIGLSGSQLTGIVNPAVYGPEHVQTAGDALEAALSAGITFFDLSDRAGGGTSERAFGEWLASRPEARRTITIATKGGLRGSTYDLSYGYLRTALDASLSRLRLDSIDLYQLMRPDPLTHPSETARMLNEAIAAGKIRHAGVCNYWPEQVRALQKYLDAPLIVSQMRLNLCHLEPIYEGPFGAGGSGVLDQCMASGVTPLANRPLAFGALSDSTHDPNNLHLSHIRAVLARMAEKYDAAPAQVALAWLLAHPAGIVPLIVSSSPAHIRVAAAAVTVKLTREDWYELWVAARGKDIP